MQMINELGLRFSFIMIFMGTRMFFFRLSVPRTIARPDIYTAGIPWDSPASSLV